MHRAQNGKIFRLSANLEDHKTVDGSAAFLIKSSYQERNSFHEQLLLNISVMHHEYRNEQGVYTFHDMFLLLYLSMHICRNLWILCPVHMNNIIIHYIPYI